MRCKDCLKKAVNSSSESVPEFMVTLNSKYNLTVILEVHKIFKHFRSHLKIIAASGVTNNNFHDEVLKSTKYGAHIKIP
jgi:hypothetical protein